MPDKPSTILLIDDREPNRYAVSRILQKAGFAVLEAGTGEDGMRLAAVRPDLVILDVNLPDVSGLEVCKQLKANPATAAVPILHLSASLVGSEARSEGLESGADGYLTYPLEPRELVATVEALLRVRRAEREVRAQRELLHVTLSSIGDGVVATDLSGTITFINPVAQALTGWAEVEALGQPLTEVFRIVNEETGLPLEDPVAQVIRSGRLSALANHTLLVARDGTRRPVDDTAAPIRDEEGRFVGVVLVFRDVTERRRLEAEVRRRSEDLLDRDRRKDEFLAMLAHELRNPLAPIRNALHVLRLKYPGPPEVERLRSVVDRQVTHLVRLVDDLLDVSRITRGKLELRRERVELSAAVARSVEGARLLIEERGHHLEIAVPAGTLTLLADPARLEQVLGNLLTNAARYTPPGGHIRLTAEREGAEAVVRVRDDGIGIRPEMLARLFEMFQQADRVPGRVSEGLGLGLALVRTLVEMHGGSVTASSEGSGRGSEFVVRLPLAPPGEPGSRPSAPVSASGAGRRLRLLIVDDNHDAGESLAVLLRLSGDDVRWAGDGPEALRVAAEFRPEVVLMDIGLPKGMDGYELARRLRDLPGLEGALLVALTGYGQQEDRDRSRAAGFAAHLVKPADLVALRAILAEFRAALV
jgi:PAS domain S-box-containing protein